jgi:hypothetical protein
MIKELILLPQALMHPAMPGNSPSGGQMVYH